MSRAKRNIVEDDMSEDEAARHEREAMRIRGGRRSLDEIAREILIETTDRAALVAWCWRQILGAPREAPTGVTIRFRMTPLDPEWRELSRVEVAHPGAAERVVYVDFDGSVRAGSLDRLAPEITAEVQAAMERIREFQASVGRPLMRPEPIHDAIQLYRGDRQAWQMGRSGEPAAPIIPRVAPPTSAQRAREKTRENVRRRPPRRLP